MKTERTLLDIANEVASLATGQGAQAVAATASRMRVVDVSWREGRLEKIGEATTRGVSLDLYVDGRFSAVSTSDLRPEALKRFVADSVSLARVLAPDPHRRLPDLEWCRTPAEVPLELEDVTIAARTPHERLGAAEALEASVRAVKGAERFNSVTTGVRDALKEIARVHSNGFQGALRETSSSIWASASITDAEGRRPGEWASAGARFCTDLPSVDEVGRLAGERTVARVGAKKGPSETLAMVVENRAAAGLVSKLLAPLSAWSLQQKRSCYDGKVGQPIGNALLDISDDPLVRRGVGSRPFDDEGLEARRFGLFEKGVLRNYYVDNYYGRKLGLRPTTAHFSNLSWKVGAKPLEAMVRDLRDGILVTGFLGGNSNTTTGDFSVGIQGFRIRNGERAEPIAEMNVAGNHLEFWKKLVEVGSDPYPWSPMRTPSLHFERVQFAGV